MGDAVYGPALAATWEWLGNKAIVDFGVQALGPPSGARLLALLAPRPEAPLLRPGDLDRWVQTQPAPSPDPDPALWLHGLDATPPDVTLAWRDDLTEDLLREDHAASLRARATGDGDGATPPGTMGRRARDLVTVLAPTTTESVAVPVAAVRRWLADRDVVPVADVDGASVLEETSVRACRPFLVWRGEESTVGARPSELRPGDVIVVPASYGGYSRGGWDPASEEAVPDRAHEAHLRDRGTITLRLRPQFWSAAPTPPGPGAGGESEDDPVDTAVAEWLDALAETDLPPALTLGIDWLRQGGAGRRRRYDVRQPFDGADWLVLVGRRPPRLQPDQAAETVDSEPDTSSFSAVEVSLDDHLAGVGVLAGQLAERVGLPSQLAADIQLAGRLHDLGKADHRFQLMLHRGDEVAAAMAEQPLAKSALPADDQAGRRRAAQLSGYPPGMRHEMLSVAMVQDEAAFRARASDWDLVQHLIASHHGHARPFAPAVIDPAPRTATYVADGTPVSGDSGHCLAALDSGVAERFWRVLRRYGWFRLAWLEAILRLADHRCSEQEQRGGEARS